MVNNHCVLALLMMRFVSDKIRTYVAHKRLRRALTNGSVSRAIHLNVGEIKIVVVSNIIIIAIGTVVHLVTISISIIDHVTAIEFFLVS